jgi:carboxypeptidase Taq
MSDGLDELKNRLHRIHDLRAAANVLEWDQLVFMPGGGAPARGRQMATLIELAHLEQTDPEVERLIDAAEAQVAALPPDSDQAALVRVARRDFEKAIKVPPSFMAEFTYHLSAAYQVWAAARPANDYQAVMPMLERTLDFSRQMADFFPGYEHIADPLIDYSDPGMTVGSLRRLFDELRGALVPMVRQISEQLAADDGCLHAHYPQQAQLAFGRQVIKQFGYDFDRGREDLSPHPFTTSFSIGDVRITTRVRENDLSEALFGTLHEAGHGMYEQGINPDYEGLPLADGASSGVHESQSRLWENVVGRSRDFWKHFYPGLQQIFPNQLGQVPLDSFYRAINKVAPSLIRTEADEVTYNLHVMLRFDLELAMLEGRLAVKDLPDAWRARFQQDFGISPGNDADGVMQDMHWFGGRIGGAFQGYTLGNVLSAQFFEAALKAHPEIEKQISGGEFGTLLAWLRTEIYALGRKYLPEELVERVTGSPMTAGPYLAYLQRKFGELYEL